MKTAEQAGRPSPSRHTASQQKAAINPVGASSNYTNDRLHDVSGKAHPDQVTAAPRSTGTGSHAVTSSSVDTAQHGHGNNAADQAPAHGAASAVDHPGLSGLQESALPAYQLESQGRFGGQKGGARDMNKPQDQVGSAVEPGTQAGVGPVAGSAKRPLHVTGAVDLPHGSAVEPSHRQGPAHGNKADKSYQQAAKAFATSPTEADQ